MRSDGFVDEEPERISKLDDGAREEEAKKRRAARDIELGIQQGFLAQVYPRWHSTPAEIAAILRAACEGVPFTPSAVRFRTSPGGGWLIEISIAQEGETK